MYMIVLMRNYIPILLFLFFKFASANAEVVKSISVNGNERITDQTVIVFSYINVGDDLKINDLNEIIEKLYETDFFKDVSVTLKNN
ncbi:outer membrane protein assembly factor BamA, partial [Candidatus Pelagibacter sp.]|nr:outer membrane protein assembly factor BamA [Candidatus Pelagibacter sp.]